MKALLKFLALGLLAAMVGGALVGLLLAKGAEAASPGDHGTRTKYCLDERSGMRLMETIAYRANSGYVDAIRFGWVDCVDSYLQPSARPVRATLLERRWKKRDKFGNLMVLWKARAYDGAAKTIYVITRE